MIIKNYSLDFFTQKYLEELLHVVFPSKKINNIVPYAYCGTPSENFFDKSLYYGQISLKVDNGIVLNEGSYSLNSNETYLALFDNLLNIGHDINFVGFKITFDNDIAAFPSPDSPTEFDVPDYVNDTTVEFTVMAYLKDLATVRNNTNYNTFYIFYDENYQTGHEYIIEFRDNEEVISTQTFMYDSSQFKKIIDTENTLSSTNNIRIYDKATNIANSQILRYSYGEAIEDYWLIQPKSPYLTYDGLNLEGVIFEARDLDIQALLTCGLFEDEEVVAQTESVTDTIVQTGTTTEFTIAPLAYSVESVYEVEATIYHPYKNSILSPTSRLLFYIPIT